MSISFNKYRDEGNSLLIVDALNLAFRWKHMGSIDFYEEYLRTINSLKKSYKAKYVIVVADQGSSSYRRSIYPNYKQNRKDKYAEQTQEEADRFLRFFQDYKESLDNIRSNTIYPVIQFDKVEADDLAAYIVSKKLNVDHTWLISTDKDWDLLITKDVSRFSYITRKETTFYNWSEARSYSIEDYIALKCLQGDSGDNILGVAGIGEKRAINLIEQYGSLLDIVEALPINSHLKYIKELNDSRDLLLLNYRLMYLPLFCEEAIGNDNIIKINNILNTYIQPD